ncbi:MAG: hypothetical protein JKY33_03615 [Bacteroidia bacterium]|nr:hypothetical protein [Bacteroidia bacterium]
MKRVIYFGALLVASFSFAMLQSCGSADNTAGTENTAQEETHDAADHEGESHEGHDHGDNAEAEAHEGHDHEGGEAETHAELTPHVCNSDCNPETGCSFKCGEEGHTCTDACKAS